MEKAKKIGKYLIAFCVIFGLLFTLMFLIARCSVQNEWNSKVHKRSPEIMRGIIDAMTKYYNNPPNFLPASMLDDEVCDAAVVNAVNYIIGEEKLKTSPAWLFSKVNQDKLEEVYNREADFVIEGDKIIETVDRPFRLSKLLPLRSGMYIIGYHYIETRSDRKIIEANADKNSHLMLLLGQNSHRWYGYHLIHYPGQRENNPVIIEPVDQLPDKLDLVYIWRVKDVYIPKKGKNVFLSNNVPAYKDVLSWINLGGGPTEYYFDTVSAWIMNMVNGTENFATVLTQSEIDLFEVDVGGKKKHGQVLGFYKGEPVYYNAHDSNERTSYGLKYQCVEFVNRFYARVLKFRNMQRTGGADSYYWDAEKKGLVKFENPSTSKPRVNDILVFDGGPNDGLWGHVAIIFSVEDDNVCFVQQNVKKTWTDCLPLSQNAGMWMITKAKKNGYPAPVAGWSRIPDATRR